MVWFRNDLRLHDNEMLVEAIAKSDCILPVYFFDPRHFTKTKYDTLKTGVIRAQFLIESVAALRSAFKALGGNLLIVTGKPEDFVSQLVTEHQISQVYHHREVADEETKISIQIEDLLWKQKVNLKHFIGHTLYNKEDLPFPVKDIPDVFAQFKKKTERDAIVKPCFLSPEKINFVEITDWGEIPTLNDLGIEAEKTLKIYTGGEAAALTHLNLFLQSAVATTESPQSLKKNDVVSKLSAWLALGCLSPRKVYWELTKVETKYGNKTNFSQILLGILWRDYFRFMFKKYGNTFFKPKGFNATTKVNTNYKQDTLQNWKNAKSGNTTVDLVMQELNTTGYINHACRQLVATYFIYNLKINWVMGAAYFEEKLIDYCPASNWGNWANIAGVGNDGRTATAFDFEKQVKIFDAKMAQSALQKA